MVTAVYARTGGGTHLGGGCQLSDGDADHTIHVADPQGGQSLGDYGEAIAAGATCCIYPSTLNPSP